MSQETFNEIPSIISAAESRMAFLFLLDISESMSGDPINSLNASINKFKGQVCKDPRTTELLDVAIVTFNHETQVVMPFTSVAHMKPVDLVASGGTEMAPAVQLALDMIDERCRFYRRHLGSEPFKPWILMVSDGCGGDVSSVSELVHQKEKAGLLKFCSLGIGEYDSKTLHLLSGDKVQKLDGYDFTGMFDWVTRESAFTNYPAEPDEDLHVLELSDDISQDNDDWWFD